MKIAIFSDNFFPGVGGTENAVHNFASELAKDNEVMVICPNYHKCCDDSSFLYKVKRVKSIKVTKNDFCAIPSLDRELKNLLKSFKPDIIQTETFGPISNFGIKFAKKNKIRVVSTVHTKYRYCYRRATHLKFLSEMVLKHFSKNVKKADRIVAVSNSMKKELIDYGIKNQISIIKNGGIKREIEVVKQSSEITRFIYVGLIVKYKNLKFTLDALQQVKKNGRNFVFNIIGKGQDRKYFEKYAKKIGLEKNINFLGVITSFKELETHYANSELLLFPSIFDTDGLTIVEAGNMGTPSLVLENTGASERITNNFNGFTCQNDVKKFAERIIEIIDNKDLLDKVKQNAKTLMTSWEDSAKSYLKIYKELLTENEVEKWKYSKNLKSVG